MPATAPSDIAIIGLGHRLPVMTEDNEELCKNLDVTPKWIIEKTGIQRRYIAGPDDTASQYSLEAAQKALRVAEIEAREVDLIIACTFSGDYLFPPLSAKVHKDLGLKGGQIFDLQANCAGFVSGLTVAADRMKSDASIRNALVIGVEFNSRIIDRADVNSAIYHSDGAGAAILGRKPGKGIIASSFYTDSSNYESVRLRGGGSSFPLRGREFDAAIDMMELNGIATWKQAITHLPTVVRSAFAKAGYEPEDADFLIFHQANLRLIEYLMRKMKFDFAKTHMNVQEIGNTGAASVAIALSEAYELGLLKKDGLLALAAVGAGFNFGASVWRWAMDKPGEAA
ncbi:MAG: 3-oxoacyl-(acyl-carrier-protein) synthase [Polaromonas sp.]|nr:3-oxoacyl-(acyl-carrier-protein) synthase [Polaromonas sp.]